MYNIPNTKSGIRWISVNSFSIDKLYYTTYKTLHKKYPIFLLSNLLE